MSPDTQWSTERLLVEIIAPYEAFGEAELARFEAFMTTHLWATRPSEINFAFKNGVNRRYLLVPANGVDAVGPLQMRRRALEIAGLLQRACPVEISPRLEAVAVHLQAASAVRVCESFRHKIDSGFTPGSMRSSRSVII